MAESAVKAAASQLGKVLVEEGKYLWGAEGKVAELRNELLWMQRFLKKAESLEFKDEIVDQWVLQIKEYVSEAEDIIDDFIIDIASKRKQVHWLGKLKRWSCIVMELWALHQAASSIDSLTHKVSSLTPKLTTYGVNPADGLKIHSNFPEVEGQRPSYAHLENKKIIGLIQDTKTIVEVLNGCTKENRRVVAIYGMGGLGKTTLATKVYNDEQIKSQFKCRAWAYISKQFQFQTVLKTLIADLTSKSAEMFSGNENEGALIRQLRDFLQKNKCLVVLDDVWETKVWDALIPAFPRDGADPAGSKVLITTRKENVAKHADSGALAKPERLKDDDSWNLLKHTLGWAVDDEDAQDKPKAGESSKEEEKIEATDDHGNTNAQTKDAAAFKFGPEMFGDDGSKVKKLGMEMVKNCNGIPLAIVVLGGILRKKNTLDGWRLVSENISSYLRRGHDHGKSYMDVLVLSYADLPYYVKPCFLHLGNYPEDYEIQAEKLCRMWVAEGLITWPYDRPSSKESLEDIANEYLSHLEQAGMIQVMKKASDGRIRSIRMHDLMRDVCLQKATTENFFTMIDHRSCPNEPQSFSSSLNHARMLHMAIYLAQDVKDYIPDYLTSKSHKYLRSLLLFEGEEVPAGEILDWMNRICHDFPRLRVLDIEGLPLEGKLGNGVRKMKHLRYLSLKGTNISEIPSSIGNLTFLETLDLRVSFSRSPVGIPNTLWKLEKLRHLFLPKKSYKIKKSNFLRLDTLRCLEVLKNLETAFLKVEDLQKLRMLKKLTIKDYAAKLDSIKNIVNSPAAKSGHLRSCSLCVKGEVIDADREILSRFDCLRLLKVMDKIKDKISPLKEYVLPQSLVELHMESCELINDPMRILGSLAHLKHLSLGYKSFVGTTLTCNATSFPHLAELNLRGLANLKEWTLEKGSMPELKKLIIMDCGRLKKIPEDLTSSAQATCSPCISGIERFGTCNYYGATFSVVNHEAVFIEREDDGKFLSMLTNDQLKRVVLAGIGGIGKTTLAKWLYRQPDIKKRFDSIAWVRCPFRKIPSSSTHFIEGIRRQIDPITSKDISEDYQTVPESRRTLLILPNFAASLDDLVEKMRTHIAGDIKILLTTDKLPNKEQNDLAHYSLKPLKTDESFKLFHDILAGSLTGSEGDKKAELGKQLLEHCSDHPRPIIMLAGLLAMKKSLAEWKNFEAKILQEAPASQPETTYNSTKIKTETLYQLCYHDLPTYLQECFLFLSNFPENTEIPARKLYQMWIAAGFVIFRKDGGVSRSSKKRKQGSSEVETLLENVAATYLNELVIRGMVQVEKRGPDKRICTCRLPASLRTLCLNKAEEKGFKLVRRDESSQSSGTPVRDGGVNSKGCLQKLYQLGRLKKVPVPVTDEQPQPPLEVQASNETVHLQHLAVYLNQSGGDVLDNITSKDEELKSLLFFPEACAYNWDCFVSICERFRFLQVLDLEGMVMIKGSLPDDVQKLGQLRYLSLKGTHVISLPTTIQQLSRLQTLDLRIAKEHTLQIPGDSFIFPHLTHLYLPESFSVTKSSKLQLGSSPHLQTLANMHTQKVDLDCLTELKDLRRVSVNYIHEVTEFDNKLKYKGTAIEISIKGEILNDSTRLCGSKNMQNVTIKGSIPKSLTLANEMFPLGLKELKFKHTALLVDPIPILRELPGLTHLVFDHGSFLMKRMTFTVGFSRLNHLTLRQLSILEVLDMTEADHLRHIEPVVIDCWRLEVMHPTGEIEVGPLEYHPLIELLLPSDADEMEEEEEPADMEKGPMGKMKSIRTLSLGKRTRKDSVSPIPKKSGLGDVAGPSAQVGDSQSATENSFAEPEQQP